jgi:cytosine/adenosine deaminase-related metal-dependent hydrolase
MNQRRRADPYPIMSLLGRVACILCLPWAIPAEAASTPEQVEYDLLIRDVSIADVEEKHIILHQDIGIVGGRIAAIARTGPAAARARTVISGKDRLALPGFIDTHTHLWQHIARSFEPSANLQRWISIYKYAHVLKPSELERLTYIAAKQAQLNGITTVADFASVNFRSGSNAASLRALQRAHMGGYHVWWNPAVFLPSERREAEIRRLRASAAPLDVVMGFGPLSFTVMPLPAVYDGIRIAKQLGLRMTEHTMENLQESRDFRSNIAHYLSQYGSELHAEDAEALKAVADLPALSESDPFLDLSHSAARILAEDAQKKMPKLSDGDRQAMQALADPPLASEVPLLEYLGALDHFLAIHSVWVTPADLDIYTKEHVAVSHNPESNMYLASGVAPVIQYRARGIPVSLGTDGAASNDGIDMLSAMRFMSQLQKVHELDPEITSSLTSWDVLRSATLDGAAALGKLDRIGSLAVGKQADLVLLRTDRMEMAPFPGSDPNEVAIVINSADTRDIDTVFASGHLLVSGGRLVGEDEGQLARELDEIAHTAIARTKSGYDWSAKYVASASLQIYGSVRKPDVLDIEISNTSATAQCVMIAFSGRTFGGTAPAMLGKETLARFPLKPDANDGYAEWFITLAPQGIERLKKAHESWHYELSGASVSPRSRDGRAEQLLLLGVSQSECQTASPAHPQPPTSP